MKVPALKNKGVAVLRKAFGPEDFAGLSRSRPNLYSRALQEHDCQRLRRAPYAKKAAYALGSRTETGPKSIRFVEHAHCPAVACTVSREVPRGGGGFHRKRAKQHKRLIKFKLPP